jgi:hypothetical protein
MELRRYGICFATGWRMRWWNGASVVPLEMAPVIMRRMTLMTATYELQERLKPEHFRALGEFSNTYGLQKFRYDERKNLLHFDYDASRLTDNVVESVLRQARIPVLRRLEPAPQ